MKTFVAQPLSHVRFFCDPVDSITPDPLSFTSSQFVQIHVQFQWHMCYIL